MKIKYDAVSHTGSVRDNNEDMALVFGAFLRNDAQRSMVPMKHRPRFSALVADGMGGYGGGEIASELTLRSFDEFLTGMPDGLDADNVKAAVKQWFRENNAALMTRAASDPALARMGTTLTGIFTYGPYEFMINTGDSRVYRRRYDVLRQITTDHSERERLGDPAVASNLIYNAIGIPEAFVDVICLTDELPLVDGDTYLICSDGLSDMISDDEIDAILASGGNASALVDAALQAGGRDNCTVVLLNISIRQDDDDARVEPETVSAVEPVAQHPPRPDAPESNMQPSPLHIEQSYATAHVVQVPVEAAVGFSIDDDCDTQSPDTDNSGMLPPPVPEYMKDEAAAPCPDEMSVSSRARTAGNLIREAFTVLFKKH